MGHLTVVCLDSHSLFLPRMGAHQAAPGGLGRLADEAISFGSLCILMTRHFGRREERREERKWKFLRLKLYGNQVSPNLKYNGTMYCNFCLCDFIAVHSDNGTNSCI